MLIVRLLRKHGFGFLIAPMTLDSSATITKPASPSTSPRTESTRDGFDTHGFRKVLYSSVLATDMSLHFAWIARLKEFGARMQDTPGETVGGNPGGSKSGRGDGTVKGDEDDRIMISQAIIKCADISNPVSLPLCLCMPTYTFRTKSRAHTITSISQVLPMTMSLADTLPPIFLTRVQLTMILDTTDRRL